MNKLKNIEKNIKYIELFRQLKNKFRETTENCKNKATRKNKFPRKLIPRKIIPRKFIPKVFDLKTTLKIPQATMPCHQSRKLVNEEVLRPNQTLNGRI